MYLSVFVYFLAEREFVGEEMMLKGTRRQKKKFVRFGYQILCFNRNRRLYITF